MITLEQFKEMEKGTIIYIAAGGRANNLVVDRFHSVHEVPQRETDTTMILTYAGGMSFVGHLNAGNGVYLIEEEARATMSKRAKMKHDHRTDNLKAQIANLQRDLEIHLDSEPVEDYTFIDRTDTPEPEGWLYDKTV